MQAELLAITRTLPHVCSGIVFAKACTGQSALRPGPTRIRSPLAGRDGGSKDNGQLGGQERRRSRCIRGFRIVLRRGTRRSSGRRTACISTSAVGRLETESLGSVPMPFSTGGWYATAAVHCTGFQPCIKEAPKLACAHCVLSLRR